MKRLLALVGLGAFIAALGVFAAGAIANNGNGNGDGYEPVTICHASSRPAPGTSGPANKYIVSWMIGDPTGMVLNGGLRGRGSGATSSRITTSSQRRRKAVDQRDVRRLDGRREVIYGNDEPATFIATPPAARGSQRDRHPDDGGTRSSATSVQGQGHGRPVRDSSQTARTRTGRSRSYAVSRSRPGLHVSDGGTVSIAAGETGERAITNDDVTKEQRGTACRS